MPVDYLCHVDKTCPKWIKYGNVQPIFGHFGSNNRGLVQDQIGLTSGCAFFFFFSFFLVKKRKCFKFLCYVQIHARRVASNASTGNGLLDITCLMYVLCFLVTV